MSTNVLVTPSRANVLLTPAHIGAVEMKNRIVMPPMTTRLADAEGYVTDDTVNYYMARVRGGTGLITVEMASPTKAGRHRRRELGIYDDRFLPGLTRLVTAIKAGGARASIQIGHGGGHTRIDICGETPVAPSAIPHPVFEITDETIIPKEMSADDIAFTIAGFAAAAARAEQAGFDCVEIHAAHGYLISQFVTPFENRRTDRYGGSLENRARFGLEVLRAVKAAVRIPVIYRVSVEDFFPDGSPFAEGRQVALWAAQAGADALHIAAGHYRSLPSAARMIPPMAYPDATFLAYAAEIKKEVAVPVIAVGRTRRSRGRRRCDRFRQGRFHCAGSNADRGTRLGGEARPWRAGAALSCLQHLRQRDARRHPTRLCRQRRRRPRDPVSRRRAAAGRAYRRHRRRTRRPYLRLARCRRQRGHGVRARAGRGRRVPPRRKGAAVPGGGGCAGFVRPLHRAHGRGVRAQGRDVPLRHRCLPCRRRALRLRPHRDRDRGALPLRPRPPPRACCSTAALANGRACDGCSHGRHSATGSTIARGARPARTFVA